MLLYHRHRTFLLAFLFSLLMFEGADLLRATAHADPMPVARIDSLEGSVDAKRGAKTTFEPVSRGDSFLPHDTIRTGPDGRVGLIFSDGVLLRLAGNSTLEFQEPGTAAAPGTPLRLNSGTGYFFSRSNQEFPRISSPVVSTAIRGTEFVISTDTERTEVTVLDGQVSCENSQGTESGRRGEQIVTTRGTAPRRLVVSHPEGMTQWALYYPYLFSSEDLALALRDPAIASAERDRINDVVTLAQQGEFEQALALIRQVPHGHAREIAALIHAGLAFSRGAIGEAEVIMRSHRASTTPATIPLREALELLLQVVRAGDADIVLPQPVPDDATPALLLAMGLAAQAHGDLEKAAAFTDLASERAPSSAYALARRAELALAFDDIESASELLAAAAQLAPLHPAVLTVRGFLELILDSPQAARATFDLALRRDPASGTVRLGRGLAAIREGDLSAGRAELAQAVYLEPQVSVFRSYLGKAYFEEENEPRARHEYQRAIDLDPNDPTPYLYRAYERLSANDPVGALGDIERSIARNDARAVFRSRELLDRDLAVRSASVSEVFTSLGLPQIARIEAIKALRSDYLNFSAHRLLAESYNSILLADAASSEFAIARLLSPLSFNLIRSQPNSATSFNDYSALFERPITRAEVGADFSDDGPEIAPFGRVSGKGEQYGFLLSYEPAFGQGTKQNGYDYLHRGHAGFQFQPSYDNRFLFEAETYTRDRTDDGESIEFDDYRLALGYLHRIDAAQRLLLQGEFANHQAGFGSSAAARDIALVELPNEEDALSLATIIDEYGRDRVRSGRMTAQYLIDTTLLTGVLGFQGYSADVEREEWSEILADEAGFFDGLSSSLRSRGFHDLSSTSAYLYSTAHLTPWFDVDIGGAFTAVEFEPRETVPFSDERRSDERFLPKAGATLTVGDDTTVRGGYFETMRKSSLEDAVELEPTLVGGLNQRFNDLSGAYARNFGLGIDHKFGATSTAADDRSWLGATYVGVEALRRHVIEPLYLGVSAIVIDVPALTVYDETIVDERFDSHQDQLLLQGYLGQVLGKRTVFSVDYRWSQVDYTAAAPDDYTFDLHRIQSSLRYFDPRGWFGFGTATWRTLDGDGEGGFAEGSDTFWLFDLGVGYRIPRRHGNVVFSVTNLFDQEFAYDQSLGLEEVLRPERALRLAFSVNF